MKQPLTPALLAKVVERLRALADPTRVRILQRLQQGEANVTGLATELGVNQASMSKHLAVLRRVGVVATRRVGVQAIVSIRDRGIIDLCALVCDGVESFAREEHAALLAPPPRKRVKT
jgi:ArsR family transcriptional regulator